MHSRFVVATNVSAIPFGSRMRTKYKYRPFESAIEHELWLKGASTQQYMFNAFANACPDVFAKDGIPVIIDSHEIKSDTWDPFGYGSDIAANIPKRLLYVLCLGLAPATYGRETKTRYTIHIFPDFAVSDTFMGGKREDNCFSPAFWMGPYPMLFYNGTPDMHGFNPPTIRKECKNGIGATGKVDILKKLALERETVANAVAVRLKELEDAGKITDATFAKARSIHENRNHVIQTAAAEEERKKQDSERRRLAALSVQRQRETLAAQYLPQGQNLQHPQFSRQPQVVQIVQQVVQQEPPKPKFSITKFEPVDTDNDFSYSYEVTLNGDASPSDFFSMYESFVSDLKRIYQSMNPAVDMNFLRVDAKPSLRNGKFVGVARILTIQIDVDYDAATRRGKIKARFGDGQEQFARAWVKRAIMEPIVKDKNILLTTGETPPPGKYCSLGEKIVGNTLEMEFRTE